MDHFGPCYLLINVHVINVCRGGRVSAETYYTKDCGSLLNSLKTIPEICNRVSSSMAICTVRFF